MPPPEAKNRTTWRLKMPPIEVTNTSTIVVVVREGTSTNPAVALGPKVIMLRSATTVEKNFKAAIPLFGN